MRCLPGGKGTPERSAGDATLGVFSFLPAIIPSPSAFSSEENVLDEANAHPKTGWVCLTHSRMQGGGRENVRQLAVERICGCFMTGAREENAIRPAGFPLERLRPSPSLATAA